MISNNLLPYFRIEDIQSPLINSMISINKYDMNHTKKGELMYYLIVLWRCFFFYSLIAASYRLMGKREMGELSIMDFIVSIFFGYYLTDGNRKT